MKLTNCYHQQNRDILICIMYEKAHVSEVVIIWTFDYRFSTKATLFTIIMNTCKTKCPSGTKAITLYAVIVYVFLQLSITLNIFSVPELKRSTVTDVNRILQPTSVRQNTSSSEPEVLSLPNKEHLCKNTCVTDDMRFQRLDRYHHAYVHSGY